MNSRSIGNTENISLSNQISSTNTTTNICLVGHTNSNVPPQPSPSFTGNPVNFYTPYQLPYLSDPVAMMNYMDTLGFEVVWGNTSIFSLSEPTSVSSVVSGNQTLTWSTLPANWQRVLNGQGTITFTQGSATGTVSSLSQEVYAITLSDVSTAFTTSGSITVQIVNPNYESIDSYQSDQIVGEVWNALQATITQAGISTTTPNIFISTLPQDEAGFGSDNNDIFNILTSGTTWFRFVNNPYDISTSDDLETYQRFFTGISQLNQPISVNSNMFGTIGIFGTTQLARGSDYSDLNTVNNYLFSWITMPYDNSQNTVYQTTAQINASILAFLNDNQAPFNSKGEQKINGIVSTDNSYNSLTNADCPAIVNNGISPVFRSSDSTMQLYRPINTMLTNPSNNQPISQYIDIADWQVIYYFNQLVWPQLNIVKSQYPRITPDAESACVKVLTNLCIQFQDQGMFQNVSTLQNQITAVQDPEIVTTIDLFVPISVTALLLGVNLNLLLTSQLNFSSSSSSSSPSLLGGSLSESKKRELRARRGSIPFKNTMSDFLKYEISKMILTPPVQTVKEAVKIIKKSKEKKDES